MSSVNLADLVAKEGLAKIYQKGIDILAALGVDTTAWLPGDPTRTTLHASSQLHEIQDALLVDSNKAKFLDLAEGVWLSKTGETGYNTPREAATYAECTVRLTSTAALPYTIDPDDLTLRNSVTNALYRNSTGGTLNPASTLDLTITAEQAGTSANALIGEINVLVTALPNVTASNLTVATGRDAEKDATYRERIRGSLSMISPGGAASAYDYVATTTKYNGGANVTRTRTLANNTDGTVTVYCANASGGASGPDVALVQAAIELHVEPLTIEATAVAATNVTVPVTYQVWVYSKIGLTTGEIQTKIATALQEGFSGRPIGGDRIIPSAGYIYQGWVQAEIIEALNPHAFRCVVSAPASDVALTDGQVAILGTITPTVTIL